MEITDRDDLGVDLNAPQRNQQGADYWSYSLIRYVREGDVVLHYFKPDEAIVGWSRAVGGAWSDEVVWGAKGASARSHGVEPYRRPGWRLGLENFAELVEPLTLERVRESEALVIAIRDKLRKEVRTPYFPFVPYRGQPLRTFQGYLVKFPAELVAAFDDLGKLADRPPSGLLRKPSVEAPGVGRPYRRARAGQVKRNTDPWSRDPALVDRALEAHASTQNALAEYLGSLGIEPRSPLPHEPDFDIAWISDATTYVGEVKSLTVANEEKQLRLGIGQVLRYRQTLSQHGPTQAVLVVERRPSDAAWLDLCESVAVQIVWPGSFDRLR